MGKIIDGYEINSYFAKKDNVNVPFVEQFSNDNQYRQWAKKVEERALSDFYNKKINLIVKNT